MSIIKDIVKGIKQNIMFAHYHLCFQITNPFEKEETEQKLKEYGIEYVKGFDEDHKATMYGVVGISSVENILAFIKWFKRDDSWHWFEMRWLCPIGPKIKTYIR